ncbi:hypothetical protein ABZ863_19890 [Saccharomonospora sp. NPDC046836]|uniref:hypothetical protein n=1 Tax=Saccharomonospora sp. NPDC046836 TaxID=3156921 RepID=UPI0033F84CC7
MNRRDPIVNPLQASVHRKLDDITRSLLDAGAGAAQHQGTLVVAALRAVLAEHRLDAGGHCTVCHGRRLRLFTRRRRRVPCRAYLAAQLALGPDIDEATRIEPNTVGHHHQRRTKPDLNFVA